jgi:hypothetical protein
VLKGVKDVQGGGILVVAACRPFGCHAPREYTALLQSDTTVVIHLRQVLLEERYSYFVWIVLYLSSKR